MLWCVVCGVWWNVGKTSELEEVAEPNRKPPAACSPHCLSHTLSLSGRSPRRSGINAALSVVIRRDCS